MGGASNTGIENEPSAGVMEQYERELAACDPTKARLGPRLREALAETVLSDKRLEYGCSIELGPGVMLNLTKAEDGSGERLWQIVPANREWGPDVIERFKQKLCDAEFNDEEIAYVVAAFRAAAGE